MEYLILRRKVRHSNIGFGMESRAVDDHNVEILVDDVPDRDARDLPRDDTP